jgi:hypothetical protein
MPVLRSRAFLIRFAPTGDAMNKADLFAYLASFVTIMLAIARPLVGRVGWSDS